MKRLLIIALLGLPAVSAEAKAPNSHKKEPTKSDFGSWDEHSLPHPNGNRWRESYIERKMPMTVHIRSSIEDSVRGVHDILGSGVIIKPDGTILTAYHVVKNSIFARASVMRAEDDSDEWPMMFQVRVVAHNEADDVALLVPVLPHTFLITADTSSVAAPKVGTRVWHFGQTSVWAHGLIKSCAYANKSKPTAILASITADFGDSGGPLLDESGHLLGILLYIDGVDFPNAGFLPIGRALKDVGLTR